MKAPLSISRRDLLRAAALSLGSFVLPGCANSGESRRTAGVPALDSIPPDAADAARLRSWVGGVRERGLAAARVPVGRTAGGVGELALGTPYRPNALEEYLKSGGSPTGTEPLILSLLEFDCVTLVECSLGVARVARGVENPGWAGFAREVERMRYRGGRREGYTSRLHYFSEWISDGAARGLLQPLGEALGGRPDHRPLRFMSTHRSSYPALADGEVYREIVEMERSLDDRPRWVIPTARIADVSDRIQTGDVLAFATGIEGLDVTHSALAYRAPDGVLRVLHAPLSGGVVEITRTTLPEYVAAIRRATGILVARPV